MPKTRSRAKLSAAALLLLPAACAHAAHPPLQTSSARQLASPAPAAAAMPVHGTRSLYTYHRDDQAAVTRIRIDAARTSATPLSPNVFGNFVEHLADVVYQGLWADALINPNLERGDPKDPMPPYWDQTGAAQWLEKSAGYDSPSCERLSAPDGLLGERIYLPVQRESHYTLSLALRAPQGAGTITLELRGSEDADSPLVLSSRVPATDSNWVRRTLHWTIPVGRVAVGQHLRFVIRHAGRGGPVDVDQIRLVPDDNVLGMDPDAIRYAKAWDFPILRLAGNFSSDYDWHNGVGPVLERPTLPNTAWGGIESNEFGTDEYLDLCKLTGATSQIGANAGTGTPGEAAGWVRYCNKAGERVPIWEIGNELYGGWQLGHTDAAGNAARYVAFRQAMLDADPNIKLIATGKGDDFTPQGQTNNHDWNLAVLQAATAGGGAAPNWLSIHPLTALPNGLENAPYADQWQSAMAQPAFMDQTELPNIEKDIARVEGPQAKTKIAPTEWGLILIGAGWEKGPNHNVEAGCVYNALALNTFLRHGDWVTLANVTALLHGGCIARDHGVTFVMPEYYTGKLYADAAPRVPVQTASDGPGSDVPARAALPAAHDVPDVDVFSALTADRSRLVVFAVNRVLNAPRKISLNIAGFRAGAPTATILYAADPQADNGWNHPNNIVPKPFALPRTVGGRIDATLPPHSVVFITISRAVPPVKGMLNAQAECHRYSIPSLKGRWIGASRDG